VGTYLDEDDEDGDAAAYLQEDPLEEHGHEVQQGHQQPRHGQQVGHEQRRMRHVEGQEKERDELNVAPEGEPFEAEEYQQGEGEQQQQQARGQGQRAAAGAGAASGKRGRQRQPHFETVEDEVYAEAEEGRDESEDLGLRKHAAGGPPAQVAAVQAGVQQQQQLRGSGASAHATAGKRPRGAEEEFVSTSEDEGAEAPRQQQRTNGAGPMAGASRGAAGPPAQAAPGTAGAAGVPPARQQARPVPAGSVGLPPSMRPAVDTGAYTGYVGGGVGSPEKQRATSSFWSVEEVRAGV
jgi:hypothetical protein